LKQHNRIKLELLSRPENVGLARLVVATMASEADYNLSDLEEIKVAVSEAVSNAIIHGYQEKPTETVTMTVSIDEAYLNIIVEDQGCGITDLEQAMQPGNGSDPERMGLGFVFMKSFMDDIDVWTEVGRGTRVALRRSLPGTVPANQGTSH
jgi:stage II sporulation protein AB (anti-sigma F factor)